MFAVAVRIDASSSMTSTRGRPRLTDSAAAGASRRATVRAAGKCTVIAVPRPSSEVTVTKPPWFFTIENTIASPRPLPRCLVLK